MIRSSVKRRLAVFCTYIGGVLGLSCVALAAYYSFTRPDHPDPRNGRIYGLGRMHSRTYLTEKELRWLCILAGSGVPFMVTGAALGWPFPKRDYENARATYEQGKAEDEGPNNRWRGP